MRRSLLAVLLVSAACSTRDLDTAATPEDARVPVEGTPAATGTLAAAEVPNARVSADTQPARGSTPPGIVRGLYLNRFAVHSARKMQKLIAIADTTEINAFVIDMKDEFGLNYHSSDSAIRRNAGTMGKVRDLKALLDTLKAHDILTVARIVVFKDSVTARVNPQWTIRQPNGSIWRDHKGLAWVNPYERALWDYNIGIAEELVRLGFEEIQWDYIRFPEPYKSLPPQVFPGASGVTKPQAIAEFLKTADARLDRLGVRSTADIFGLVTTVNGPLEIGQEWEKVAPVTDVLLPMVYPSHYPRGAFGVARPNAEPYKIVFTAIDKARQRNAKLGITKPEHVRPWLQAFSIGQPPYGAAEVEAQMQAVYDAGYDGWVLWHPGSNYDVFLPALEKDEVTRKKVASR